MLPAELLDGQAGLGLPALKELTTENARLKKLLAESLRCRGKVRVATRVGLLSTGVSNPSLYLPK
ncbi:MAG: hypothetical protein ABGY72_19205 [bacterium]